MKQINRIICSKRQKKLMNPIKSVEKKNSATDWNGLNGLTGGTK
jgi:hypothetical protein